ncbi:sensor histidine kinase [Brevibacterium linens]|uniref:histidine kinase n=1 Tax=Brevibacterium linens TaxID=1703 RepID=A0A0B9A7A4_BRELN|nr:sensor histidine kinase [Brevibacterium linens]KHS51293.1 integral membrane sensor signal transduction histidine kinase [Brevibacterium linens]
MNHSPDLTSPAPADTYAGDVPRPAEPPQIGPNATSAADSPAPREPRSRWARLWRNLGRDSVLIAPSLLISLIAFPVLITLFSISIATVIVWVGVILLPLTLTVARAFGNLSRGRARAWGAPITEAAPRPRGRGLRWWLAPLTDARAWLDLLFETVFALPIRLFTFSVCLAWFAGSLGGITHFFWGAFVPDGGGNTVDFVVAWVTNSPVTDLGFAAEATFQFIVGIILLLTFPFVLHAMALLEIVAIRAALSHDVEGAGAAQDPGGPRTTAVAAGPAAGSQAAPEASSNPSRFQMVTGGEGWFWLISVFVGVVLVAISWPVTTVLYDVPTVFAMLIALAQSAALVLAVRWPIPAIGLGLLAQIVSILLTSDISGAVQPFTVTSLLALVFLHLIIGLRHRWFHLVALWSASAVIGVLTLLLPYADGLVGAFANVITTLSIAAGAGIIGVIGNFLIQGRRQLETERELSAAELAKRQELEERNRIAQELHDVVAHSMSVISVQATTAKYRLPGLDERSLGEFDSMASSARQALTEMRGLLAILRGGRDADLAPQPTVDDIPALVDVTRGSGAVVELDFPAEPLSLSPTTSLTAFRVVQESLSNALRHSAGAPVAVTVTVIGSRLEISVLNGEPDGGSDAGGHSHLGGGFGIKGMRERVEALNGSLQVGPTEAGGFAVRASLPVE